MAVSVQSQSFSSPRLQPSLDWLFSLFSDFSAEKCKSILVKILSMLMLMLLMLIMSMLMLLSLFIRISLFLFRQNVKRVKVVAVLLTRSVVVPLGEAQTIISTR
jgi:hypothetical protein